MSKLGGGDLTSSGHPLRCKLSSFSNRKLDISTKHVINLFIDFNWRPEFESLQVHYFTHTPLTKHNEKAIKKSQMLFSGSQVDDYVCLQWLKS